MAHLLPHISKEDTAMRKNYERASLETVLLVTKDIITTSGIGGGTIVLPEDDSISKASEPFG